jgi:hypothetical protein
MREAEPRGGMVTMNTGSRPKFSLTGIGVLDLDRGK